jgi:hypothetical protein
MENVILHIQDNLQSHRQQQRLGLISHCYQIYTSGPGSSVGIVTGYGLDGPGIESCWPVVAEREGCVVAASVEKV